MTNQYLFRLRKARLHLQEEDYTRVIHSALLPERGASLNRFFWNPARNPAFIMEDSQHSPRDDVSALDNKDLRWSATINHTDSPEVGGRVRLYSESQVHTVSRWEDAEMQDEENGGGADGAPFRGRSQSAPASLWKAKKYGRQLRRMSDEFDTWLDKGEMRRANSLQKQTNRGWFSFLWSTKEEEGRE